MKNFPMFLRMDGRRVVICGRGEEAARKARLILKTEAEIVVVGRDLDPELAGLVASGRARGVDEAEAVRETVAILKQADMSPLDVTGYGTLEERLEQGDEIDPEERKLMQRALDENAVIVAQMTPFND